MNAVSTRPDIETLSRKRDALVDRILRSTRGVLDLFTIFIGDRLGFYESLANERSLTSGELAELTGTHERYVREWLEQQTVAGLLTVEDPSLDPQERRYVLPPGHDEVLADAESLNYLAPLAQLVAGAVHPLARILDAYRTGDGVPYEAYGPDLREGQGRMNRASLLQLLGPDWIPMMPDVEARLTTAPDPRVADIGCGVGFSSIGLARTYPRVRIDGFDRDSASIELARANAARASVTERVRFESRDVRHIDRDREYDLVIAFESLRDMADPVETLRAMRRQAKVDGAILVVDRRVHDRFTPDGNEIEWLTYGFSVLSGLPASTFEKPSAGTGSVMRAPTLERYARDAGYRRVDVLPIRNHFFRFYRLVP